MSDNQSSLIESFLSGSVPGESGTPKRIETVISNVFLFAENVYKVYKNDNTFFNTNFRNLSVKELRFAFTRNDFSWNNTLSPSIYLELRGIQFGADGIMFVSPSDDAQELAIIMRRINTDEMVFDRLLRGEITVTDARAIGSQYGEQFKRVQTTKPDGNFYNIFDEAITDVRNWVKDSSEHAEELLEYCDFMDGFRESNREWFEGALTNELAPSGDVHSHNALYTNGELFLMDTYAPKDSWAISHRLIPFYRLGADLWALGSKELFEAYVSGYEEVTGERIDRKLDTPFIMYGASIMVSYLSMLQEANPTMQAVATRYLEFARDFYRGRE